MFPGGAAREANVALSRTAADEMPRQFGPRSRAPCARIDASNDTLAFLAFGADLREAGRDDADRPNARVEDGLHRLEDCGRREDRRPRDRRDRGCPRWCCIPERLRPTRRCDSRGMRHPRTRPGGCCGRARLRSCPCATRRRAPRRTAPRRTDGETRRPRCDHVPRRAMHTRRWERSGTSSRPRRRQEFAPLRSPRLRRR